MAGYTRGESASNSLDGTSFSTAYQNGQRGAYAASCLDRSGSFRENSEPRIMVSGPGTSRSSVSSSELPPLTQFLSLESFSLSEQKYSRSGELRRVLGVTVEEHAFGSVQSKPLPSISSEDLRRFKGSVFDSSTRARDRAKSLQDLIQKLDKYRNMLSRKRQRIDQLSEKSGVSSMLKTGNQNHQNPTELVGQRLEDRTKNVVPNKRARSSMAEARSEGRGIVTARQGTVMEKEKNMHFEKEKGIIRGCNGGLMPADDKMRALPPGGDGWEKKLKRKRSVGTMVNRVMEGGDREIKQTIQQRPGNEPRQRSSDCNGFRPGSSSSIVASSKMEGSSQLSGGNSRIIPRNELDNCPAPNEKRERSVVLDKERVIPKGANKLGIREDAQPGTQSPLPKGKASRAPRTGSAVLMNTSLPRISVGFDGWEQSQNSTKVQSLNGATNRKRPLPTGSSSPPVTQWVGQRSQKMSRTRRANVVSPVSNLDDTQFLPEGFATPDIGSRSMAMDAGLLPNRGIANTAMQSKLKLDSVSSPAGFSECEESGALDNKFKERGSDNAELEDGTPNTYHKPATFILPTKKNKAQLKEEIGDGVRRQGRSGRTSMLSKARLPLSREKNEIAETTKPTKAGKLSSDKNESRIGRPPLKKVSDRKVYARPGQLVNSGSSDLAGESDDDHEELLAAINAAHNSIYNASSSSLWKDLQPFFAFVTSEDISFLKNQIHFAEELDAVLSDKILDDRYALGQMPCELVSSPLSSFPIEQSQSMSGPNKSFDNAYSTDGSHVMKMDAGILEIQGPKEKTLTLSQILLSAFITEDEIENLDCSAEGGEALSQYPNDYLHDTNVPVQNEQMKDFMKSEFEMEFDYKNHKNHLGDNIRCNGYMSPSNFRRSDVRGFISGDEALVEGSVSLHSDNSSFPEYRQTDLLQMQNMDSNSSDDCRFNRMPLNDRILMELHSIDLYPEAVPELDESYEGEDGVIDKSISELKMQLYHQVKAKKIQLQKLEKITQNSKEVEERTLEQLAVNNLVDLAYKRLTGGRIGSSHKSGASKVQKQLALAFAKRTLTRCQKFEDTGRSCFSEPALWDALLTGPVQSIDTKHADGTMVIAAEKHAPGSKLDRCPSDSYQGFAQTPDQSANRGKKKEVLLDDVVISASRALLTTHTTQSGPKWKKTDRERDQSRERNPSVKTGRPSLSNGRGERKTKAKPKQKIAQLSASGNGVGRVTEAANFMTPSIRDSCETASNPINQEVELQSLSKVANDSFKEIDDLPLHGIDSIDELDVAEGLGEQGQDIGSWLDVDEDALLDHDLVGLEIPMDDLSDLKLNF